VNAQVIAVRQGTELSAAVTHTERILTLQLSGTADLRVTDVMSSILTTVHEKAVELLVHKVVVDLRALEFMNSSCFKSFVKWTTQVQNLPSPQYRIHFLSNPSMLWQRRSLHALSCFAADLVSIGAERA
jgi:hypothetical protein